MVMEWGKENIFPHVYETGIEQREFTGPGTANLWVTREALLKSSAWYGGFWPQYLEVGD